MSDWSKSSNFVNIYNVKSMYVQRKTAVFFKDYKKFYFNNLKETYVAL